MLKVSDSRLMASVVIPARDREQELPRAIQSVLAQTHRDLKLLVVDDHSVDGTGKVVERYAAMDARVRLLPVTEGSGAPAARNTGIRAATGAYVAFLDSDDEWQPEMLEKCLDRLRQTGRHVAYTEGRIVHDETEAVEPCTGVARLEEEAYTMLLRRPPGPVFSCLVVERQALLSIGGLDQGGEPLNESLVAFQEWDTCLRLARACGDFAFVDEGLFTWHRHGKETISGDGARNADGYAQVVEKHSAQMLAQVGRGALAAHYSQLATMNDKLGRKAKAWHFRCKELWLSARNSARAGTGGGDRVAVANGMSGGRAEEGIRVYG